MKSSKRMILALLSPLVLAGCSVVMEASRPTPVDLGQFVMGEERSRVTEELGPPIATVQQDGKSCDVYDLYTSGPGSVGRGAIATTEAVADILTLGLAEIVTTPVEGVSRSDQHTVTMCYDNNLRLASERVSHEPYIY